MHLSAHICMYDATPPMCVDGSPGCDEQAQAKWLENLTRGGGHVVICRVLLRHVSPRNFPENLYI